MASDEKKVVRLGRKILEPVVDFAVKSNIPPNALTISGFILTFVVAALYGMGFIRTGGIFLALAGMFDGIDGEVARRSGRVTKFGAFLDSVLDRFSEFLLFGGLLYYYRYFESMFIIIFLSLMFSIMVSYTRARGEGLGASVKSGLMDRVGRYIYLIIASLIDGPAFGTLMLIFMLLTGLTVVARIARHYNKLNSNSEL